MEYYSGIKMRGIMSTERKWNEIKIITLKKKAGLRKENILPSLILYVEFKKVAKH